MYFLIIITRIEKLIGIAKATIFPRNEPEKKESPTIIEIPAIAKTIEIKQINEIFSWKKVRVPCASACGILLMIVMAFIADYEISENTFKRWSIPFASIEKKTFTQIQELKENSSPF